VIEKLREMVNEQGKGVEAQEKKIQAQEKKLNGYGYRVGKKFNSGRGEKRKIFILNSFFLLLNGLLL
jgi:hypothetical protein